MKGQGSRAIRTLDLSQAARRQIAIMPPAMSRNAWLLIASYAWIVALLSGLLYLFLST